MARKIIDFTKPLNADDEQFVRERPWMIEEAESGLGLIVTFESDGKSGKKTKSAAKVEETEEEDEDEEDDESDDDEDDVEDYSDTDVWVKKSLQAEIDRRNEQYDEDEQIVPAGKNRGDLVAALIADDAELAAGEDDEDDE